MAKSVLVTGFDAIAKSLGPMMVAGLGAYAKAHALDIKADFIEGAGAEQSLGYDTVVLIPASRQREGDNAILDAAAVHGDQRLVIVSDTWQAWRRIAPEYRGEVSALTVCFAEEAEAARKEGYAFGVHVVTPPHWGKMYDGIMNAHVAVQSDEMLPLVGGGTRRRSGMKLIYFGGAKNPPLMNKVLAAIAAGMPADGVLCFRPHPAEGANEAVLAERAAFLASVRMLDHKKAKLDDSNTMVANADVSIFVGGPTDSIGGAYARRPMLYFDDPDVTAHNLAQDLPEGRWFVPELGGAHYATEKNIGERLAWLIAKPAALVASQEAFFPLPATWDTGLALAEVILNG